MADTPICAVDGCDKPIAYRKAGLCNAHYLRLRRHGDPLAGGTPYGAPHDWLARHVGHDGDDCLTWPFSTSRNGYGTIRHGGESMPAHRRMCELAHGPAPSDKPHALHSCGGGKSGCVNPRHLRWGTPQENQRDRIVDGTSNRGERCGASRLTEGDVLEIRRLLSEGTQQKSIAEQFGVHPVTIIDIKQRRTWAWLRDIPQAPGG